jgi:HSP20 family molecular chaperone IbpA
MVSQREHVARLAWWRRSRSIDALVAFNLRDVEEDKVSAAFKNGVLTITAPKSAEAKNVRRIAINPNG